MNNSFVSYSHGCSGVRGFRGNRNGTGVQIGVVWDSNKIQATNV